MTSNEAAKTSSFAVSNDFLKVNAATVATVTQIPPKATALDVLIGKILDADGLGSRDLSGFAEDKRMKRDTLERLMHKVGKGAAAYYLSSNMRDELRSVDFKPSELYRLSTNELLSRARDLHKVVLPDVANLIGITITDLDDLEDAKEAFADVWIAPKRAKKISKGANDKIKPLLDEGDILRAELDIYMQTFEYDNPDLYAEWKLTLSIDNNPTHSNPDLATPVTCGGLGVVTTVDYAPIVAEFTGAADIKFILPQNIPQGVAVGFGADDSSFVSEQALSSGSNNRVTAASLGYDINGATFLNIRNATPNPVIVNVAFYLDA